MKVITVKISESVVYTPVTLTILGDGSSVTNCIELICYECSKLLNEYSHLVIRKEDVLTWADALNSKVLSKDIYKLLKDNLKEKFELKKVSFDFYTLKDDKVILISL